MDVPSPWEFLLLGLAAWRVWYLIAEDDLTQPLRDRIRSSYWRDAVECPYCSGAWVAGTVWVGWSLWPRFTVWFAVLWALSAAVVIGKILVEIGAQETD